MKKINNKTLRILGIIMSMIGLSLFIRPIISIILRNPLQFSFFNLFSGTPAIITIASFLIFGLTFISITKPLEEENR